MVRGQPRNDSQLAIVLGDALQLELPGLVAAGERPQVKGGKDPAHAHLSIA